MKKFLAVLLVVLIISTLCIVVCAEGGITDPYISPVGGGDTNPPATTSPQTGVEDSGFNGWMLAGILAVVLAAVCGIIAIVKKQKV